MIERGPVNWESLEWEFVRSGVKRKVIHAEGCTLVLNHLEPSHEPKPHAHNYEQVVYIVQGEVDFTVESTVWKLTPGSVLAIPPNVEHFARVTGLEMCINVDVFVPRREDYVQSSIKR